MKSKELHNLERSYITIGQSITNLWDLSETLPIGHSAEKAIREAETALYTARNILKDDMERMKTEIHQNALQKLMQ